LTDPASPDQVLQCTTLVTHFTIITDPRSNLRSKLARS
jgi:hypothetical protein